MFSASLQAVFANTMYSFISPLFLILSAIKSSCPGHFPAALSLSCPCILALQSVNMARNDFVQIVLIRGLSNAFIGNRQIPTTDSADGNISVSNMVSRLNKLIINHARKFVRITLPKRKAIFLDELSFLTFIDFRVVLMIIM